jgi:ankyrin repeat protein
MFDNSPLKNLYLALESGNERQAIQIYTEVGKTGTSLERDHLPSAPFLLSSQSNQTPIHMAARYGLPEIFDLFLQRGGDPSNPNTARQSCLHCVCQNSTLSGKTRPQRLSSSSSSGSGAFSGSGTDLQMAQKSPLLDFSGGAEFDHTRPAGRGSTFSGELLTGDPHSAITSQEAMRLQMLRQMLQWRGMEIDGHAASVSLNAADAEGNAPVHYAASSGLVRLSLNFLSFCLSFFLSVFLSLSPLASLWICVNAST